MILFGKSTPVPGSRGGRRKEWNPSDSCLQGRRGMSGRRIHSGSQGCTFASSNLRLTYGENRARLVNLKVKNFLFR